MPFVPINAEVVESTFIRFAGFRKILLMPGEIPQFQVREANAIGIVKLLVERDVTEALRRYESC